MVRSEPGSGHAGQRQWVPTTHNRARMAVRFLGISTVNYVNRKVPTVTNGGVTQSTLWLLRAAITGHRGPSRTQLCGPVGHRSDQNRHEREDHVSVLTEPVSGSSRLLPKHPAERGVRGPADHYRQGPVAGLGAQLTGAYLARGSGPARRRVRAARPVD
jgi:hypothetical protein